MRLLSLTLLLVVAIALPANAATRKQRPRPASAPATPATKHLGGFDAWNAYTYTENSNRVCYLVGDPRRTEPIGVKRKVPTAMVTHRPEEKVIDVVSFTEGYPLKPGADAGLDIGGSKFDLFTNGDTAWSRTADLDKAIVAAMVKGHDAVLTASPEKGPQTTDIYSLAGFSKTLALIDKACGVKR